jgi:ribonuclease-3
VGAAAEFATVPRYEVRDTGPDHEKTFTATVAVDGEVVGDGEGRSKKEAEQRAAREAYATLVARSRLGPPAG